MIISNVIICEKCGIELQSENLGVKLDRKGNILRVCINCGNEVIVK